MNFDYRFPLLDSLLNGRLDPMLPGNSLKSNYEIRLQDQIIATANDTGIFRINFIPELNVKCKFYKRLLLSETFLYCEDVLIYIEEEKNNKIRTYLRDTILDKHLLTNLKKLGERIQSDKLNLAQLTQPTPDSDIELLSNIYIFQLLKICLTKAYLEVQHSLRDVVMNHQTESMIYSAYFGELPPVKTFLTRLTATEHKKEQVQISKEVTEKELVSSAPDFKQNDIVPVTHEYYTVQEVSKILKVDDRTVCRRIEKKEIIAIKDGGKHLIDKKEFDNYLRNKTNLKNKK
ncbi:MAG: helix-turn-helix domain-containing protein [Paludibacter sp.]